VVLRLARTLRRQTGKRNLCLAGGVALNCVANGRLLRERVFDDLWIQPAAGDAGGSVGAALAAWHGYFSAPRTTNGSDKMKGSLIGPEFADSEVESQLATHAAVYRRLPTQELIATTADVLAAGQIVGWFQGRMEFGPRALGNRSIIGDPRNPNMQSTMNLKIKFRESFRPFAPSVLADSAGEYFDIDRPSPYMLIVAPVAAKHRLPEQDERHLFGMEKLKVSRSDIPAVTHVDCSARVQTVQRDVNERFHDLIEAFGRLTGCPMLINTSFNVRGEPIVCTPDDAYRCFMRTNIDVLVVGNHILFKRDQPEWSENTDWRKEIALD
jgi:carbamoyltransferase